MIATDEINAERDNIVERLNDIIEQYEFTLSKNRFHINKLISGQSKKSGERSELVADLCKSINSYPQFIASRIYEEGYVGAVLSKMEEHHEQTKKLASVYFSTLHEVEHEMHHPETVGISHG